MDSQGWGRIARARDVVAIDCSARVGQSSWARAFQAAFVVVMLLAWNGGALAQTSNYAYDANGRLVGVTQNDNAAQYSYDANGNLLQISSVAAGQVAIFSFMPTHGASGSQVVISGKGFATTPAGNTVSFNGAGATVLSASANQLVVTVPSGATTGPISVTVGTQTATSSASFVIDNTGLPPVITQVSPAIVAAGAALTTTGTHLYPVTGETTIQLGSQQMALTGSLDTQLQSTVPSNGSSGYVSVQTPYGKAKSLAPIIVVPPGINAANVVSTGYVSTAGQTVSLNIPAANQMGAVLFDGTIGSWLTLQPSAITTTSSAVNFAVYGPGNVVLQTGTVSATAPSIHLPQLPANGTYLVTFTPTTASAQMTLSLETNTVLSTGQPVSVTTLGGWQSKRIVFNTLAGQDLELNFNGVNVGSANYPALTVYIYNVNGAQVAALKCNWNNPAGSCLQHIWQATGGVYTAYVVPAGASPMSYNAVLQQDASAPLALNGSQTLALAAGQVKRFTFTGQAGQLLALQVSANSTPSDGVNFLVYRGDVGPITSTTSALASFDTAGTTTTNLPALPSTGTYTVIATPHYGLPAAGQVQLLPNTSSGIAINGAATKLAANGTGQSIYFTFTAIQGEDLELSLNQLAIAGGSSGSANLYVYNSAGGQVSYTTCNTSWANGSCILHLWGMWAGTYTVVVAPSQGGTLSFNALVQDVINGGALQVGAPQAVNLGAGQVVRYTFNANAGDTLAVNLSNFVTTPGNQLVAINVYRPDGGNTVYASTRTDGSPTINLPNLPVSGTYRVAILPYYGTPMTGQIAVYPGLTGTLAAGDQPITFTSQASGQYVYMTFVAQQDDDLELLINHLSMTATGYALINFNVVDSNGTNVAATVCSAQKTSDGTELPSCEIHLWHMRAGTYRVMATPYYTTGIEAFSAQLQRDVVGPDLTSGTQVTANLSTGQVERFTFTANAGDTLALQLANVATTPYVYNQGVTFLIYQPYSGSISKYSAVYASADMYGTSTLNLRNLPSSGKYTVIMVPDKSTPATAQLRLYGGSTGALPNTGTQQAVATNVSGQSSYLTFTAQAGDNLELTLNGVTITNGGSATASVNVYNAAGSQVASFNCAQSNPNGSCMQPLWNLAAGTYTAIVSPYSGGNGGTLTFNAMIQPDIVGQVLTIPGGTGFLLGAGQVERVTFKGLAGDTVKFQVQNESTWPAGYGVNFIIYRPDGGAFTQSATNFASYTATGNLQTYTLPVLPVSGSYTMVVMPQYGLQGNAQLTMLSDTSTLPVYGTPTFTNDGTPVSQSASAAGQNVTMTINANGGDNLQLTFSGINVVGASTNGFRVDVYDPSGKQVTWNNCYASSPGGSCRLTLWNLISGSYKVVASPSWGGTINFNAQVMPDIIGPALAANAPTTVNLPFGGVERMTFTANAGDNVSLALSGATTTPAGQPVYINVYRPDTGFFSTPYATTSTTGATAINLANLPASGTYTVVVYTAYGQPGSVNLNLVPGSMPALVKDAAAQNVTTAVPGQNVYTTFNASQGDNLELSLGGLQGPNGASISAQLQVFGPAGNQVSSGTCYTTNPGGDCRLSLWNLPAGQYSVVVAPQSTVQMSFTIALLSDIVGPTLALNTPTPVNLAFGQVQRLTFTANAGDTVALSLASVTTVPAGKTVYATVYRPDSGAVSTSYNNGQVSTTGSNVLNLANLPETGTYTVVVSSDSAEPAQATLTLLSGITGTLPVGSLSPKYGTTVGGQNAYLTFTANRGDNMEFSIVSFSGYTVTANIYDQNGTQISSVYCTYSSPGASCLANLWNLAGGTYSVIATGPSAYNFNVLVRQDTIDQPLSMNVPTTINLAQGDVHRLSFNAKQGDDIALAMYNITTTPSGQNVCADIYRPDTLIGSAGYYGNQYAEVCGGQTANLSNLPVGGTYTVVLQQPGAGAVTTASLLLGNGLDTSLTTDGPSQNFASQQWNANYYVTLHTNPGDNLELAFNGVWVPGNRFMSGIALHLYDATGKALTTYGGCDASSVCMFSLWNLAGGDYKAVISPDWNGTMNFNVQLNSDIIGPVLDPKSPTTFSIPQGHVERFTFNASAGQSVALNLSGVTIAPSNQPIFMNVYRPDGGAIVVNNFGSQMTSNYYTYVQTSAPGTTLNLPALPVSGTYTVILYSGNGVPFTGQLALNAASNTLMAIDGSGQTMALSAGARSYLSFNTNPGDNLELTLDNMVASGGSNGTVSVSVYDANGTNVVSYNCSAQAPGGSCNQPLWNLAGGTYGVAISGSATGVVQVEAKVKRDVMGGLLTTSNPILIGPTTEPVERFMFNANAGDNLALQLSNVTTSPSGQPLSVYVYRPDVGTITPANAYAQTNTNSSGTLSLTGLPVSGTYTVIVSQNGGLPSAASLSLSPQ